MSPALGKIKPYSADWTRSFDLVTKLGVQEAIGGGSHEVSYLRGTVTFQEEKGDRVPSETKRTGKLGEVRIRSPTNNQVEYTWADEEPLDYNVITQSEIVKQVAEGLGLERREYVLGMNVKVRILAPKIPRALEDVKPLQGGEYLFHKQTSVGDYTSLITRTLGLSKGALRSPCRQIRNEMKGRGIYDPNEPDDVKVFSGMRSILRADYIIPDNGVGYLQLQNVMDDIHREMAKPNWWQDVGYVHKFRFRNGFRPMKAQIYDLEKRNRIFAVPLPKELHF